MPRLVQQTTVICTNFLFYAVVSETRMFSVLTRITASHRYAALLALHTVADLVLKWAYESDLIEPPFVPPNDIEVVIS